MWYSLVGSVGRGIDFVADCLDYVLFGKHGTSRFVLGKRKDKHNV